MPQLDITTYSSQIFWLWSCLGVLCFLVAAFLAPRLGKNLAYRYQHLQELQQKSALLLKEANDLRKKNSQHKKDIHHQVNQQHHALLEDIQKHKTETLRQFDLTTLSRVRHAQKSLSEEKKKVLDQLPRIVQHILADVGPQIFAIQMQEENISAVPEGERS